MYILGPVLVLANFIPSALAWGAAGKSKPPNSPTSSSLQTRSKKRSIRPIRLCEPLQNLVAYRDEQELTTLTTGHEIVATIAQIHLHPAVRAKLCTILPPEARCHLAPVAAWADQVRYRYPGTGPMHYINGEYCDQSADLHAGAGGTVWSQLSGQEPGLAHLGSVWLKLYNEGGETWET